MNYTYNAQTNQFIPVCPFDYFTQVKEWKSFIDANPNRTYIGSRTIKDGEVVPGEELREIQEWFNDYIGVWFIATDPKLYTSLGVQTRLALTDTEHVKELDAEGKEGECTHEPLEDTGVGYYYCPACKGGWRINGLEESIKYALQNSIENQEQENNEVFNSGREDAFKYALEMLHKHSVVSAPVEEEPLPELDFTSLFNYVKSLQQAMGLNDEEASITFWVIEMWQRKKVYYPCEFKQPQGFTINKR